MKLFGLTGGIGMGKSTAASLFRELGSAVVDTDLIARQILEPGQPALDDVKATFGLGIVGHDGQLRRNELARIVFADADARKKLELILHPRIHSAWLEQIRLWRAQELAVGVVVIPLLFETSAASHFDATICIACSSFSQQQRLRARGWSSEQIMQRSQAQWDVAKKMTLSDYVVWTEGSLNVHREQLARILLAQEVPLKGLAKSSQG